MDEGLGLDAWWDEPAYRGAQGTFTERGAFILAKLRAHDAVKLERSGSLTAHGRGTLRPA
jgi:hypothetical protein